MWGLIPGFWDHDLSLRQTLNTLTQSSAPKGYFLKKKIPLDSYLPNLRIIFTYLYCLFGEINVYIYTHT